MSIPRHAFLFWHSDNVPDDVNRVVQSWRQPGGFATELYSDKSAREFISLHFDARILRIYDACMIPAMRSDYFRLCRALRGGGMYVDAGMQCLMEPRMFFGNNAELVCVRWHHGRIVNGIFSCRPGSAIVQKIFERVTHNIERQSSNNIWEVTGPGAWISVLEENKESNDYCVDVVNYRAIFKIYILPGQASGSGRDTDSHWSQLQKTTSIFRLAPPLPQAAAAPMPPRSASTQSKADYLRQIRQEFIDPTIDSQIYKDFVAWLPVTNHYIRFCNTFRSMLRFGVPTESISVRETGSLSQIAVFLQTRGCEVSRSNTDLRYAIDAADDSVDIVLSLEVLEHIKDQTEQGLDEITIFNGSGAIAYAQEIHRILDPGGYLVLTSPNPCSITALSQLLQFEAPYLFRPHVREYTRREIENLFAALELVHYETHNSFYYLSGRIDPEIEAIFLGNRWSGEDRGDDHFFIFRKPHTAASPCGDGGGAITSTSVADVLT